MCNDPARHRSGPHAGEDAADPAHGLRDPLLVLDECEADEAFTIGAEAAARADRDMCLPQEAQSGR